MQRIRVFVLAAVLTLSGLGMATMFPAPSIAMEDSIGWAVDPPVIVTNGSKAPLLIKWQTSIPGVGASPQEQDTFAPGVKRDIVKHANFWIAKDDSTGTKRSQPNTIEVWLYDPAQPNLLLAYYKTVRLLYPASVIKDDKKVILEIDVNDALGIAVRLDKFR